MHQDILKFWFDETGPEFWWKKDSHFDELIKERYSSLLLQAAQGELFAWRDSARGRLAEIIVLDQFSRNIYRDTAKAFAQDAVALVLAQEAVHVGDDQKLPPDQRNFIYMPYMHSESRLIHQQAERLFRDNGQKGNYEFELKHKAIIDRFGRYPHRNEILGRESTAEELEFLQQPGSSF